MSRIVQVQLYRTQKTKLLKLIAIQRRCSCHDITVDNIETVRRDACPAVSKVIY
jgi:hypothetical protein